MTDEQFIEWLRKIKEYCGKYIGCYECPLQLKENYYYGDTSTCCSVILLGYLLSDTMPENWDMEEIERIIKL